MLNAKITRRILRSFLLLSLTGLLILGILLMDFFHKENLRDEEQDLRVHAEIIEQTLRDDMYRHRDQLNDDIAEIYATTGLRVTILDEGGSVLADTNKDAETMDNHWGRPEVQAAIFHDYGTATRYSYTLQENMMYVAIPVRVNQRFAGVIRTATSLQPIEDSLSHSIRMLLIALGTAFLVSIALALWLAHRQLSPILTIIKAAHAIMGGDLSRRITYRTDDEFDILIRTINQLAGNLAHKIDEAQTENQKLNLILESMDNGVLLLDENGAIMDANRQARDLFSLQPEDMRRHSIHVLGNALISETAQQVLERKQATTIRISLPVSGTPHIFKVYFATFEAHESTAVLAVFHDISLLDAINRRQAEFVSNAAHELRTPLTSIRGFAELLTEDDFSSPDVSHHCSQVILQETERMDRLITALLELARLDNKKLGKDMKKEPLSADRMLELSLQALLPKAQKKQQQVQVVQTTPAQLLAREDLFRQILQNLIDNAIKYTSEGGTITVGCREEKDAILFSVADNGIGIDAQHLPFIFDRFYRVDKARARKSGGNGIGLALVKFLVKLFGGTIEVESQPGEGTRFLLSFPKIAAPKA